MTSNFSIESFLTSTTPILKQKQRRRSSFNAVQVHWLENEFKNHRYLTPERRAQLSLILGLTQQQIKIWFQNRRYKTKIRQNQENYISNNDHNNTVAYHHHHHQYHQQPQLLFNPLTSFINNQTYKLSKYISTLQSSTSTELNDENPKIDYSTQDQDSPN